MDLAYLAETTAVGGFFALRAGEPDEGGTPLSAVYAAESGPDSPLTARVDAVAARLAAPERRIAVSIAHLGLAARLWSIALGAAALHGRVPDLGPERLYWDPRRTTPDDLLLTRADFLPAGVGVLRETVQQRHLVPLHAAFRRDTRISERLLWGNAGSALAGAVRELTAWAEREGRPHVGARARELASGLLTGPELATTLRARDTGDGERGSGPGFWAGRGPRRRSCCLYYRCPAGGLCGDCAFDHPPRTTATA